MAGRFEAAGLPLVPQTGAFPQPTDWPPAPSGGGARGRILRRARHRCVTPGRCRHRRPYARHVAERLPAGIGRRAAHAILINEARQLLLIKRTKPGQAPYWTAPGGGVEGTDASV